jgi:hypothetical protein
MSVRLPSPECNEFHKSASSSSNVHGQVYIYLSGFESIPFQMHKKEITSRASSLIARTAQPALGGFTALPRTKLEVRRL